MQEILDIARTAVSLAFLLYASISDYKTREVSNSVWILFAPIGFALTFTEVYAFTPNPMVLDGMSFNPLFLYGISFGLTSAFAVLLFYAGGFGGADAKALMCLAIAVPFYPENAFAPLSGENSPISMILFPVSVFSNAVLFAAATAVYLFLRNMFWRLGSGNELFGKNYVNQSLGRKILVLITGYKVSVDKLKEKWHMYPMEDIEQSANGTAKRKLLVIPRDEGRNETVERLAKAVEEGKIKRSIWATPGLPMLIFITIGLIISLFFGDVIWVFVRLLLH